MPEYEMPPEERLLHVMRDHPLFGAAWLLLDHAITQGTQLRKRLELRATGKTSILV